VAGDATYAYNTTTKAKAFRFCRHRLLCADADAIIGVAEEFIDEQKPNTALERRRLRICPARGRSVNPGRPGRANELAWPLYEWLR
jgi:hypothetical protein